MLYFIVTNTGYWYSDRITSTGFPAYRPHEYKVKVISEYNWLKVLVF